MQLIADRYEWESPGQVDGHLLGPAHDTLSGTTVSVLEVSAPEGAAESAREVDRLRRYARVHHPHLAEVRTVAPDAGLVRVVCEPLEGALLDVTVHSAQLTVRTVQELAGRVLDALAAVHRAGLTHGAVRAETLLLSRPRGTATGLDVTLLPVPVLPRRPAAGRQEPGGVPGGRRSDVTPADDVRAAATVLLALLRRVPRSGMEEAVLATSLAQALTRAGGVDAPAVEDTAVEDTAVEDTAVEDTAVEDTAVEDTAPTTEHGGPPAPPVRASADAPVAGLGRGPLPGVRPTVRRPDPEVPGSRLRHHRLTVAAVAAAAVGLGGLVVLTVVDEDRPTSAAPAAGTSTGRVPTTETTTPVPSPVEEPSPPLPQTVTGLVEDLTARPDAAGPAGPLLRDGLQGLVSGDEVVRQRSALQVLAIVVTGEALDPAYATATRLALVRAITDPAPEAPAPAGAPSCLEVQRGTPPPVVQAYARQILDQLPAWRSDGFPSDEAGRLEELVDPVATGQMTLGLRPCPAG